MRFIVREKDGAINVITESKATVRLLMKRGYLRYYNQIDEFGDESEAPDILYNELENIIE